MTDDIGVDGGSEFKDRKGGLIAFGIVQIIFGALCALMVPMLILGMAVGAATGGEATGGTSVAMMVPGLLFYLGLAVWSIWMGIGCLKARRWARALLLVTSWIWLISGVMGMVVVMGMMPEMYDQMGSAGEISAAVVTVMKTVMLVFMVLFYVIIPGAFVLFFRSKHVKATCEARDPCIRWTDRCPLPVLTVSLMAGFWGACMLLMGFYGWAIPFFGSIQSGVSGAVITLVSMGLLGYVAWGTYRLDLKAWWGAVFLTVAWGISATLTFSRVSLLEYYEKMNFPEAQLAQMEAYSFIQGASIVPMTVVWILAILGYLLVTRKYFTAEAA